MIFWFKKYRYCLHIYINSELSEIQLLLNELLHLLIIFNPYRPIVIIL